MLTKKYWKSVIFSDEPKIDIFGSDEIVKVRRSSDKVKGTKSYVYRRTRRRHIGLGISNSEVGRLHFIDFIMDSTKYYTL